MLVKEKAETRPAMERGYVSRAIDSGIFGSFTDFPSHSDAMTGSLAGREGRKGNESTLVNDVPGYVDRALRGGRLAPHSDWPSYTDSPLVG